MGRTSVVPATPIGPYEKEYYRADGSRSRMLFAGAALGDGKVIEYCNDLTDPQRFLEVTSGRG
jgi:hypothetical protein